MKNKTLTTIGLPIRLEVLIKSHLKLVNARTIDHWSFSDESDSDVAICDPESPLSAFTVKRSRERGSPLCISLVDSHHQPLPGTVALHDPLRVADIIVLLDRVSGGLRASAASDFFTSAAVDVEPPATCAVNQQALFARSLHQLMTDGSQDLHLVEAGAIRFCVLPVSRQVFLQEPLTDSWLDWIVEVDQEITATVVPVARQQQILSAFPHRASLIKLLWHAGLNGAQTEQLATLTAQSGVSLRRWPDFGNLKHKPVHLRMAAELSRKRMTMAQLANVTNSSIEHANSFVNACALCNLVNIGPYPTVASINAAAKNPIPPSIDAVVAAPRNSFGFLHSIRMALGLRVA